jgi:hypothetical protein
VLWNNFGRVADELRPKAAQVVKRAALDIKAQAMEKTVRVDTGAMKGGYVAEPVEGEDLAWQVSNTQDYHIYHELGTGARGAAADIQRPEGVTYSETVAGITPSPMLIPAAEACREPFEQAMKEVLG